MNLIHHVSKVSVENPKVLKNVLLHDMLHEIVSRNRTTLYNVRSYR